MNDELERIWKEAVVVYSNYIQALKMRQLTGSVEFMILSVLTWSLTEYFPKITRFHSEILIQ